MLVQRITDVLRFALKSPVIALLLLYLFLALTVDPFNAPSWHDAQRLLQLALLAAVVVSGLLSKAGDALGLWWRLPSWIRFSLVLIFVLGACSAATATLPRWAWLEWAMTLLLALTLIIVAAEARADRMQTGQVLVWGFQAAAAIYAFKVVLVYTLMLVAGPSYGRPFEVHELFPQFSNIRFFSQMQVVLMPFLVLPALMSGTRGWRLVAWLAVPSLGYALLIASGGRGGWVAIAAGAIAAFCLCRSIFAKAWLRCQLSCLLGGALLYAVFVIGVPKWLERYPVFLHREENLFTLSGRELLWQLSKGLTMEHPWLGIGPMHFSMHLNPIASHPHNVVLQWMAEWGVPAVLLATAVLTYAALMWVTELRDVRGDERGNDTTSQGLKVAGVAGVVGVAVLALVDGMLVMPVSQMLTVLLCGCVWGWRGRYGRPQPGSRNKGAELVGKCTLAVSLLIVLVSAWPEATELRQRYEQYQRDAIYTAGPVARFFPRFWVSGWIP